MKKEKLLEEFLEDKVLISHISKDYKKIIEYYDKNHGYGFLGTKIIYDFIKSNYYQLTYDDGLNFKRIEEWIKEIKEYEPNDYIFELIDIDDEVLLESYHVFQKYVKIDEDNFNDLAILKDAQYEGFEDIFGRIRKEFIKFLEGKIEKRGEKVDKLSEN